MTASSPPVTETKIIMSDPTALGVFGLSMVTFVAASQKMGWTTGATFLIPWALLLGSIAQIWASTIDFKKNNYFGSIVLGAYGLFWAAVAMHWAISQGWFGPLDPAKADPRQLAYACIGYFFFSLFIMIAAFEVNKMFALMLVLINILLPSLALSILGVNPPLFSTLAAVELMASGYATADAAREFLARAVRPVTIPEFDEYVFHDSPLYDFHVQLPRT